MLPIGHGLSGRGHPCQPGLGQQNRIGVLLGHERFKDTTQTLTHTLWALFNVLPGHTVQARAAMARSVPHFVI